MIEARKRNLEEVEITAPEFRQKIIVEQIRSKRRAETDDHVTKAPNLEKSIISNTNIRKFF